jgi:hypothetical protein
MWTWLNTGKPQASMSGKSFAARVAASKDSSQCMEGMQLLGPKKGETSSFRIAGKGGGEQAHIWVPKIQAKTTPPPADREGKENNTTRY